MDFRLGLIAEERDEKLLGQVAPIRRLIPMAPGGVWSASTIH
jgi:hypothetical protein